MEARIEQCLGELSPGSRLVRTWPLNGGISAAMTAFEVEHPNGLLQKMVARQPSPYRFSRNNRAAQTEFQVLTTLKEAGLPVATPLCVESTAEPFLVLEYIDGRPELSPTDVSGYLQRYAEQLARIHSMEPMTFLPSQDRGYGPRRESLNDSLREGEIRDALEAIGEASRRNPLRLCHGDFWPGNVLWRDGEIAGVIDWEEVLAGEPLADLGICRLDLWWILGEEASNEFTERYRALVPYDFSDLPDRKSVV